MKKAKNANGEGSIYFDKSKGRWCAAYTAPDGSRHVKRFKEKQDADMFLQKTRLAMYTGSYVADTGLTIGEWLILYIGTYKSDLKPLSKRLYFYCAKYLAPIADIKLSKPNLEQIQKFFFEHSDKKMASLSYNFLSSAIKKAYQLKKINENFMQFVERPRYEKQKKIEIYSREDLNKIFSFMNSDPNYKRYSLFFKTLLLTGLRGGEALALAWKDIDTINNVIHVSKNYVLLQSRGYSSEYPKNENIHSGYFYPM